MNSFSLKKVSIKTWTLTKQSMHKIKVAQTTMERTMSGIFFVILVEVRCKTKVDDVSSRITTINTNKKNKKIIVAGVKDPYYIALKNK